MSFLSFEIRFPSCIVAVAFSRHVPKFFLMNFCWQIPKFSQTQLWFFYFQVVPLSVQFNSIIQIYKKVLGLQKVKNTPGLLPFYDFWRSKIRIIASKAVLGLQKLKNTTELLLFYEFWRSKMRIIASKAVLGLRKVKKST